MAAGVRSVVLSVVVHAAALGGIARSLDSRPRHDAARDGDRGPIAIEVVERSPAAPAALAPPVQPIDVAVLSDEPPPALPDAATAAIATAPSADRAGRTRAAAEVGQPGAGSPAAAGDAASQRPNPLAMRGLRHDLSLHGEMLAKLPGHPVPEPVKPSGHIQPGGREGRIDDRTASYVVHGDGTMDVTDKADLEAHLELHLPTRERVLGALHALGDDLDDWRKDPYRDTRVGTSQDLPRHLQSTPDSCQKFGDPMCDADPPHRIVRVVSGGLLLPVLAGKLDIMSYLQRKFVGDPFASRKRKVLDDTRAERIASGSLQRAAQLDRSAELMARNLDALSRSSLAPAARRQALFELWDECTEGDDRAGAAGERARAMVIGWIGAHLAHGQPDAFSADDIARLDATRASTQHFAPY